MGPAQCGDCCEARRAMDLSGWLSTEDHRPGAVAVTVRKASLTLSVKPPIQESFFFPSSVPLAQTLKFYRRRAYFTNR